VVGICAILGIITKTQVDDIINNNGPIIETNHMVVLADECNDQVVSKYVYTYIYREHMYIHRENIYRVQQAGGF
jgi:hypothetical protein